MPLLFSLVTTCFFSLFIVAISSPPAKNNFPCHYHLSLPLLAVLTAFTYICHCHTFPLPVMPSPIASYAIISHCHYVHYSSSPLVSAACCHYFLLLPNILPCHCHFPLPIFPLPLSFSIATVFCCHYYSLPL